jgi:GH18 family chitinase
MGSTDFSNMVTNDASRANFIRTSVIFVKKHKFDGLGNYFYNTNLESFVVM